MTSSSALDMFAEALEAPKAEVLTEEVIIKKETSVDNLVFAAVSFSSYLYQLNTQAHLLHLNLECREFLALHEFLKEQYEQHIGDFDMIAEIVRSMDYLLPSCQCGLMDSYKKFKSVKNYEAREGLMIYTKNLEQGGMMAKDLSEQARATGTPDLENSAAEICGKLFKGAWMLKATLRNA